MFDEITETDRLCADVPPDAGGEYANPDGLVRWLSTRSRSEIERTAKWVRIHYTNTDLLMRRIEKCKALAKN